MCPVSGRLCLTVISNPLIWWIPHHGQNLQLCTFSLDPETANTLISRILERLELVYGGITCDDTTSQQHRTFDGSCNNQRRPEWGMVNLPLRRYTLSAYSDGEDYVMSFFCKINLIVNFVFWLYAATWIHKYFLNFRVRTRWIKTDRERVCTWSIENLLCTYIITCTHMITCTYTIGPKLIVYVHNYSKCMVYVHYRPTLIVLVHDKSTFMHFRLITFWMYMYTIFPQAKKLHGSQRRGKSCPVQELSPGKSQRTVMIWLPMVMPPSWFTLASF